MRRATVAILVGCGACRGLLGIEDPIVVDDAPAGDTLQVRLTWKVADAEVSYPPITPAPSVRAGPIDGALEPVDYQADGTIEVPASITGATWRLEYTIDGVAHEVHWKPEAGAGHVIVPLVGRVAREAIPSGAGYRITPTSGPTMHPNARVYTTGVWSIGVVTSPTMTVDYPFALAVSLGGPLGAPDATRGDQVVLADISQTGTCIVATGAASFATPPLSTSLSAVAPIYTGVSADATVSTTGGLPASRVAAALEMRWSGTSPSGRTLLGHVPHVGYPAVMQHVFGLSASVGFALPGPPVAVLADCDGIASNIAAAARPVGFGNLPIVVHTEALDRRRSAADGPFLASGLTATAVSATGTYAIDLGVPLAYEPITLGAVALDASDRVALPAASGSLALSFALEPGRTADYFEVVLHELELGASPQLHRRRVYTATALPIAIDPSVLSAGREYVLSLHAYRGRPDAALGNYATVAYPQAASTIFTRTFIAQ